MNRLPTEDSDDLASERGSSAGIGRRSFIAGVLARSISGPVLRPGDPGFEELALPFNAVPARATAFVHRDNDWYMVWYLKWKREDSRSLVRANLAWLDAFYNAIAPYAIGQAYQNFVDPSLTDFLHQYYAVNLRRLERIKAAVDPHQVFNFPQAIPPAR
jgi:FAD/FMN-containing dehydrogenase